MGCIGIGSLMEGMGLQINAFSRALFGHFIVDNAFNTLLTKDELHGMERCDHADVVPDDAMCQL